MCCDDIIFKIIRRFFMRTSGVPYLKILGYIGQYPIWGQDLGAFRLWGPFLSQDSASYQTFMKIFPNMENSQIIPVPGN